MHDLTKAASPQPLVQVKRSLIPAKIMLQEAAAAAEKAKDWRLADRLHGLEQSVRDEIEYLDNRMTSPAQR